MKLILNESSIDLKPENHADKMYIARFIREVESTKNIEATFSYSKDRTYTDAPKGGGWLDPKNIVETLYDAEEDEGKVAIDEIKGLRISMFDI